MSVNCVELACTRCKKEVVLPLVEGRPGYVSIKPITDWTAPPLLCPDCSDDRPVERDWPMYPWEDSL